MDPRASTPRDIEACRSPYVPAARSASSETASVPQVRQTQGVPRAVFNRLAPHPPRWSPSREGETCCVTLHRFWAQALGGAPVTGASSAYRPSRAPGVRTARRKQRGLGRRAFAPHLRCEVILPATAPRPASGDADQTPLRHRGGITLGIHTLGILSTKMCSRLSIIPART